MQFLEFFGMPGVGKTYTLRNLRKYSSDLKLKNKFFVFEKRTKTSICVKTFYIVLASFLFINTSYIKKIIIFFKNFYKPKKSEIISIRTFSILFNTIFLVSIIRVYSLFRNNKNIFIDQGFFQILFSIIYEMDLKNIDTNKSLIKYWLSIPLSLKKNIYVIYFESEDQIILKRLKYRNGDSMIDRQENLKNLKIYKDIFDQILDFLVKENENYPNIYLKSITSFKSNIDLLKL